MDFSLTDTQRETASLASQLLDDGKTGPWKELALATLMTGMLPIARWADGDLRRALLPPAAAGETILTAGIREPSDPLPRVPAVTVTEGTVSGPRPASLTAPRPAMSCCR
jgi:hypothetical protein